MKFIDVLNERNKYIIEATVSVLLRRLEKNINALNLKDILGSITTDGKTAATPRDVERIAQKEYVDNKKVIDKVKYLVQQRNTEQVKSPAEHPGWAKAASRSVR